MEPVGGKEKMKHTSFREESGVSEEKPEPKCPHKPGTAPCKVCPDWGLAWRTFEQGVPSWRDVYKCGRELKEKWK